MIRLGSCFNKSLKDNQGASLIEMMIIILILGLLSIASLSIIEGFFDDNFKSSQRINQQQSIVSTFGFISSRLASADVSQAVGQSPLGLSGGAANSQTGRACPNNAASCTDPLTISGDQIVIQGGDNFYYRIWYDDANDQIRAAIFSNNSATLNIFSPNRGPSEPLTGAANSSNPIYDYIFDLPLGRHCINTTTGLEIACAPSNPDATTRAFKSFIIGDGIKSAPKWGSPNPNAPGFYQLITFFDNTYVTYKSSNASWFNGKLNAATNANPASPANLNGYSQIARSNDRNTFYNTGNSTRSDIRVIRMNGYMDSPGSGTSQRINSRFYSQPFVIDSVCVVN